MRSPRLQTRPEDLLTQRSLTREHYCASAGYSAKSFPEWVGCEESGLILRLLSAKTAANARGLAIACTRA
jgi:hypothetical protein